jgi:hypothetical protein
MMPSNRQNCTRALRMVSFTVLQQYILFIFFPRNSRSRRPHSAFVLIKIINSTWIYLNQEINIYIFCFHRYLYLCAHRTVTIQRYIIVTKTRRAIPVRCTLRTKRLIAFFQTNYHYSYRSNTFYKLQDNNYNYCKQF